MIALNRGNLPAYAQLMRLDRPIGTYLVAWPAVWALWLAAGGVPDPLLLGVFLLGALLMRSAGCVINDYADRDFDAHVERTAQRPFATGAVSEREALQLFLLLLVAAAGLLLFTNPLTALLALAAVGTATLYPFTKRFIQLPQLVLGIAFSWAVPMAFAAHSGSVTVSAWILTLAVVIWVLAYDTFYGMVDRADDLRIGIKSTAILFGRYDRLVTAGLQLVFLLLMAGVGAREQLGALYLAGLAAAATLFAYQQWLVRARDPQSCFAAFLNNNYVGLVIFVGLALDYAAGHPLRTYLY